MTTSFHGLPPKERGGARQGQTKRDLLTEVEAGRSIHRFDTGRYPPEPRETGRRAGRASAVTPALSPRTTRCIRALTVRPSCSGPTSARRALGVMPSVTDTSIGPARIRVRAMPVKVRKGSAGSGGARLHPAQDRCSRDVERPVRPRVRTDRPVSGRIRCRRPDRSRLDLTAADDDSPGDGLSLWAEEFARGISSEVGGVRRGRARAMVPRWVRIVAGRPRVPPLVG